MRLITHFNAMIRSRLLWGCFAAIVSLSFIGAGAMTRSSCQDSSRRGVVGRLSDEDVTSREFLTARYFEVGMRDNARLTPEDAKALERRVWHRLAALRAAEDMGIGATDREVGEVIARDPGFSAGGVFDKNRYRSLVESQLRVSVESFEAYLRQDLILRKLGGLMESSVWTLPAEVEYRLGDLTDVFEVEYALYTLDESGTQVEASDEDTRTFYEENSELFRIPERVSVRYATFPIAGFESDMLIDTNKISAYYDEHLDEYLIEGTNEEDTVTRSLAEVSGEIEDLLRRQEALFKARDEATGFVMALAPERYGAARSMEETAAAMGIGVATSHLFAADEPLTNLAVSLDFNRVAFRLDAGDPEGYFSDAIGGDEAVYVIATSEREQTRVPEFDEVSEAARPAALAALEREAFVAACRDIRDALSEQVAGGTSFREACAEYDLNVSTTKPFTVLEAAGEDMEYGDVMLNTVRGMDEQTVSEVVATEKGAIIVYVRSRTPGDAGTRNLLMPDVLASLDRLRSGMVFEDWSEYMLGELGFEDLSAAQAETGEAESTEVDPEYDE